MVILCVIISHSISQWFCLEPQYLTLIYLLLVLDTLAHLPPFNNSPSRFSLPLPSFVRFRPRLLKPRNR